MPSDNRTDRDRIALLPFGTLFTYHTNRTVRRWEEGERVPVYFIPMENYHNGRQVMWILPSMSREVLREGIEGGGNFHPRDSGDIYPLSSLSEPWKFSVLRYGMTGELIDAL